MLGLPAPSARAAFAPAVPCSRQLARPTEKGRYSYKTISIDCQPLPLKLGLPPPPVSPLAAARRTAAALPRPAAHTVCGTPPQASSSAIAHGAASCSGADGGSSSACPDCDGRHGLRQEVGHVAAVALCCGCTALAGTPLQPGRCIQLLPCISLPSAGRKIAEALSNHPQPTPPNRVLCPAAAPWQPCWRRCWVLHSMRATPSTHPST